MTAITVILPVYNGIKYLDQSVQSVLKQDFQEFEFLILDDCSTDGSWDYLRSLEDARVQLFRNEHNRGLFYNLNFLAAKAHSPIIKLWSQDDVLYPNCFSEVVKFHLANPAIGFSYTGRDYIDDKGQPLDIQKVDDTPPIVSPRLHARIAFFTGSIAGNIANVAINKWALEEVGRFNEEMTISGDFEMWVRLAKDHPVGFIHQPLVRLRNHAGQLSGQEKFYLNHMLEDLSAYQILLQYVSEAERKEGRQLLRHHKLLFYYTLMLKALLKGKFKTAGRFGAGLHNFDNIFMLSGHYFLNKLGRKNTFLVNK